MEEKYNQNNRLLKLFALPKGNGFWRIDWFGDIAFPDRTARRKQPSVFLHLSRVTDRRFLEDPSVLLSPECTAPARFQKKVWVSVGTLPMLRVGDIWRDGMLECRPDYELERFAGLEINSNTTSFIKAGLNLNEQGYLLPLAEHPWHLQNTKSYCLMVKLPENKRLIVPCLELVRFYFGSSSGLLSKLFMPPLEHEALYSNAQWQPFTGRLSIELAEGISGASASDIGRIHTNPVAWRAAALVGASALRASVAQQPIHPQGIFPFEGKTDLIACGKWLSFAGQERSTFIVYSLRSCSHPFPFKTLRYEIKGGRSRPINRVGFPGGITPTPKHTGARDAKHQELTERDASGKLAPKVHPIRAEARFPDLLRKTVWKSTLLNEQAQKQVSRAIEPVDKVAVGEPGSVQRIRPMDLAMVDMDKEHDRKSIPSFLQQTIAGLQEIEGIRIELLTQSDEDGWTVPVSVLCDEDGVINPKFFLDDNTENRLRRACVLAFSTKCDHLCAVLIEANPVHIRLYPTSGLDPDEVWLTLQCAAEDFSARRDKEGETLVQQVSWAFCND